jgi:hypothetical protein
VKNLGASHFHAYRQNCSRRSKTCSRRTSYFTSMRIPTSYSELIAAQQGIPWPATLRQILLSWCQALGESGYWILVGTLLSIGTFTGLYLAQGVARRRFSQALFSLFSVVFSLVLMLIVRFPTFTLLNINTDEDFLMSGIMSVYKHQQYFSVVDGTTSGPLNFVVPTIIPLLGLPLDSATIRIFSVLLLWAMCIPLFFTTLKTLSPVLAFLTLISTTLLFASLTHFGWIFYTSEHVSLMLIGWIIQILFFSLYHGKFHRLSVAALAIFLSLLPFTKLQAGPFSAAGLVCFLVLLWRGPNSALTRAQKRLLSIMVSGTVLIPIVVSYALTFFSPLAERFWISYVTMIQYISYTMAQSLSERLAQFVSMFIRNPDLLVLLLLSFIMILFILRTPAIVRHQERESMINRLSLSGVFITAITGFFVAMAPGRNFTHYLQYLFYPFWLALILSILRRYQHVTATHVSRSYFQYFAPLLCLPAAVSIGITWGFGHPTFEQIRRGTLEPIHQTFVAHVIAAIKKPSDELAVWGWCSQIHQQAAIPPATSDIITERHITPSGVRKQYQRWHLSEMKSRKPMFFVDSVGNNPCAMNLNDRQQYSHSSIDSLKAHINENFQFLYDQEDLRLYLSHERLTEIIHPAYLYPLLVYLNLTELGNSAYSDYRKLFAMLLRQRLRPSPEDKQFPWQEINEQLHRIADDTIVRLIKSGALAEDVAEIVTNRALLKSQLLQKNLSTSLLVEVKNPIRIFVSRAEKWKNVIKTV